MTATRPPRNERTRRLLTAVLVIGMVAAVVAAGSTTRERHVPAGTPSRDADPLVADAMGLALGATPEQVAAVAAEMARTGDVGWVPYLVDMTRIFRVEGSVRRFGAALAELTGVPVPEDPRDVYTTYGAWMYDNDVEPVEGYRRWKATMYGIVGPEFIPLLESVDDPRVAAELQWGGVRRGGIVELNEPSVIPASAASYMIDTELTFGATVAGESRAYPHRILDRHELANDVLGGEPVALVDCTLCRTGVLYSRRVAGQVLEFETSGLLLNSNKVMVDRQTDSLWIQLTGEAIAGPLQGTVLDRFPLTVTRWGAWRTEHPDSSVVAIPTGIPSDYPPGAPYRDYYEAPELWFPAASVPDVFAVKERVGTVELGGARLAVSVAALADAGPQVLEVGEGAVLAVPTPAGIRFYGDARPGDAEALVEASDTVAVLSDGTVRARLLDGQSFWFAWYGAHPDTAWWPPAGRG